MFAASVGGEVIFVIAMLIYGAYSAWSENKKKKEAAELEKRIQENAAQNGEQTAPPPSFRPAPANTDAPEVSEQERLRKFLEALGVPSGQAPAPPPPRQQAPPPAPRPVAPPMVAPRPVARPMFPVPQRNTSPSRPVPRPVVREVEPISRESMEPGSSYEDASVKFDKITSDMNVANDRTPTSAVAEVVQSRPHTQAGFGIREAVRTPETLRTAFLLSEILGPPVGLQPRE